MSQAPFWPVATDAFIADTTHLTAEQTGAYLMLLMCLWRNNGNPLPLNHKKLCRMARVSSNRWPKIWDEIEEFFDGDECTVSQKRLRKDWVTVQEKIKRNRQSGSLGGKSKALKTKEMELANATISPKRNSTNHNHNHKDIKDIDKSISKNPIAKSKGKPIAKRKSIQQFIRENLKGSDDLPDDYRAYAQKWGHPNPDLEWEMFVNFWLGNGECKADWLATWRNRIVTSKKRGWYTSQKSENRHQQSDRYAADRAAHGVGLRKAISMDDL